MRLTVYLHFMDLNCSCSNLTVDLLLIYIRFMLLEIYAILRYSNCHTLPFVNAAYEFKLVYHQAIDAFHI